jgi:outer membrane lipopolysaccharide assembly protein LptE/RlpB
VSWNLNSLIPPRRRQPRLHAKLIAVVVLALALGSACGYQFAGRGDLPAGVQHVFIELLQNRTSETGIETTLTGDLIYEFTRSRRGALARDRASADSVLEGEIQSLKFNTISRRGRYTSRERKVTVTIDMRLIGPEGEVLWQEKGIAESEAYDVVEDKLATEQNRRQAIADLSERIAERVFNRLTDEF